MGPLVAAGLGLAGGGLEWALGNISSARQMRFQERMSSTAHQREVADLKAAGLNPVLSATGGAGASTPPGSMVNPPEVDPVAAVMSAKQLKLMDKQEQKIGWETAEAKGRTLLQQQSYDWNERFNKLSVAEKEAMSEFWKTMGESGKQVQFWLPLLKMLFGGR